MSIRLKTDKTGAPIPGVWVIDYYPNGRNGPRRMIPFGAAADPKTEAEALALEMELRRTARREPVSKINAKFYDPLVDFKREYKNDHAEATIKDLDSSLVHLVEFFGKFFLAEIVPAVIEQYKGSRLQTKILPKQRKKETAEQYQKRREEKTRTISKRTINKELSYLSGYLRWCEDNGYLSMRPRVKLFPAKQTKPDTARPLHPSEVDAMLQHLEPQYLLPFMLYNDAGLRRAEVLGGGQYTGLRCEDIDLKNQIIYVRGKGNKERIVPITTKRLRQQLTTTCEKFKTGFLCRNPKTKKPWYSIRKALLRAAAAAGIERRVYHHLLRHNFGTHAVAAGMNIRSVQEFMGHSTIKTTEIYTHMAPYLQAEAAKLQQFLEPEETTAVKDEPNQNRADTDQIK